MRCFLSVVLIFVNGCLVQESLPEPAIDFIAPPAASSDASTTIEIVGARFFGELTGAHYSAGRKLRNDFTVALGDTALGDTELTDVSWVSSESIVATVPAGLPEGRYDVQITTPAGLTAFQEAAFKICAVPTCSIYSPPMDACGEAENLGDCGVAWVDDGRAISLGAGDTIQFGILNTTDRDLNCTLNYGARSIVLPGGGSSGYGFGGYGTIPPGVTIFEIEYDDVPELFVAGAVLETAASSHSYGYSGEPFGASDRDEWSGNRCGAGQVTIVD